MTDITTIKKSYRKQYPTQLPKDDYRIYQQWSQIKYKPNAFKEKRKLEKQLRSLGYGYLLGDLPNKKDIPKEAYQMIIKYRFLRKIRDKESMKSIRHTLRDMGLGAFAGDIPTEIKPTLKERYFTDENIISFSNAINNEVLGFIDTEFTTRRHEILSIGCVLYDTRTHKSYEFYKTAKPIYEKKLSTRCIELTHLTQEEIDKSDSFTDVITEFKQFLDEHEAGPLMVWGNSDQVSMKTSCSYGKVRFSIKNNIINRLIDIQPIVSLLRDETRVQFSLQDMKDYYKIDGEVEHHALSDARDLKNVMIRFIDTYKS